MKLSEREKFMIVFRCFTITMFVGLVICFCILLHHLTQTDSVSDIIGCVLGMSMFTYCLWDLIKLCADKPYETFLKDINERKKSIV